MDNYLLLLIVYVKLKKSNLLEKLKIDDMWFGYIMFMRLGPFLCGNLAKSFKNIFFFYVNC